MISVPPKFPYAKLSDSDLYKVQWYYGKYVEEYYQEYSYGHFLLAAYAAVPSLLTPDLLYKIWQNFNGYKWGGDPVSIHRVAVSDILLSPLCREIGFELYEMHYDIRMALLEWLKLEADDPIWKKRNLRTIGQVSAFVEKYYEIPNNAGQRWGTSYIESQSLEAKSYSRPGEVAATLFMKMLETVKQENQENKTELLRETELLRVMDMFVKTKKKVGILEGEGSAAFELFSKQGELMEAWKTYIQKNTQGFIEQLDANPRLLDLLTIKNQGGIELKVAGGAVEKLELFTDRKVRGLIIGTEYTASADFDYSVENENTAILLAAVLKDKFPGSQLEIKTLTGKNTTKARILNDWQELISISAVTDDIIFYIAGNAKMYNGHCFVSCIDSLDFEESRSSWLADEEIGNIAKDAKCSSITAIIETNYASTPYWLDISKPQNILFASCRYDQEPFFSTKETGEGVYCMFTYCLAESIKKNGIRLSNRYLFTDAMNNYANYESMHVNQVKTPQLLCPPEAYNMFFLQGKDNMVALQNLLRQTGYYNEKTTGRWNKETAVALDTYCKENDLQRNLSKQDYINSLLAHKPKKTGNDLPIFLLLFSDPKKELQAIADEREMIIRTLNPIAAQAELIILDDPDKSGLEKIFRDKKNRNRIELFYYSGKDDNGYMILKDGTFNLQDMTVLADFQENIKLLFANTCWSQVFASHMTRLGIRYAIGTNGVINDAVAAEFGKSLFQLIVDKKDIGANVNFSETGMNSNAGSSSYRLYKAGWLPDDSKIIWDLSSPVEKAEIFSMLIAFDNYKELGNITGAVHDAQLFSSWINEHSKIENCRMILSDGDKIISQHDIDNALEEIFSSARHSVTKEKTLLVYMSGRGIKHPVNPVFCLPGMSEFRRNEGLNIQAYFSTMSGLGVFDNVILLYDLFETVMPDTPGLVPLFGAPIPLKNAAGLSIGYFSPSDISYESNTIDSAENRHGAFTKKLLEGLNGNAVDKAGNITGMSLRHFITQAMPQAESVFIGTSADFIIASGKTIPFQKVRILLAEADLNKTLKLSDSGLNEIDSVIIDRTTIEFELKPGFYTAEIPETEIHKNFNVEISAEPLFVNMSWVFLEKWILVIGTAYNLSFEETDAAKAVGKFAAEHGYGLITGGWSGVDQLAGEAYFNNLNAGIKSKRKDLLIQVVEKGQHLEYENGFIQEVNAAEWRSYVFKRSYAIISIGGGQMNTNEMFEEARKSSFPFIPLPQTGGYSLEAYNTLIDSGQVPVSKEFLIQLGNFKIVNDQPYFEILKKILDGIPGQSNKTGLIFISYSQNDYEYVVKIAGDLENNGKKVFLASKDLKEGVNYPKEKQLALLDASYVLVIVSPGSVASKHVAKETDTSLEERKKIIPIIIADCEIPDKLKQLHAIDLGKDYDMGFKELLKSLNAEDNLKPESPEIKSEDSHDDKITPEDFKTIVERLYKEKEITVMDDLQKNRWGGKAINNGRVLKATVTKKGFMNFKIKVTVESPDRPKTNRKQQVAFFLHNTFSNEIEYQALVDGEAEIEFEAYEAFTVGAYLENGTELELDLNEQPGYPKDFYYKDVSNVFKKEVETIYQSKKIMVKDDLQKNRWGGKSIVNGIELSAKVLKGMLGFFKVELSVSSVNETQYMGDTAFFLHDTFKNEIVYKKSITGIARIAVTAYEAFAVGAYTKDGTMLELDLQQIKGLPEKFYYPEEKIGKDGFYTEAGIRNLVKESGSVMSSLLIFETSKQHTWLVFTDRNTYVLLDDAGTREKNRLIQTSFEKSKTLPLKCKDSGKTKGSKVVQFAAQDTWWYYSQKLFPTDESLSLAIEKIFNDPPGKYDNTNQAE